MYSCTHYDTSYTFKHAHYRIILSSIWSRTRVIFWIS